MNKKEQFFSTENRTQATGYTIKKQLNGIFFRRISIIASGETPVLSQFSDICPKTKNKISPKSTGIHAAGVLSAYL
jgi:hypothetical protein